MSGSDAEYMKEYRERNPDYVKTQKQMQKARERAKTALSKRHPQEFKELVDHYLKIVKEEERGSR